MTTASTNSGKLTGFAIIALRAYIKALELNAGKAKSDGEYRYEIPKTQAPGQAPTARIYAQATGQTVEGCDKPLEDWAKDGKQIRLAFIGLKDAKMQLEAQTSKPTKVRYTLNAITGEACITVDGERLADKPVTIAEWAKAGREVEKPLFESLKAAQEWGSADGEAETKAKMIALGIIRAPRNAGERS